MYASKVLNTVLVSLIVWSVYKLEFTLTNGISVAILSFLVVQLVVWNRGDRARPREAVAVIGWSLLVFALYSLLFDLIEAELNQLLSDALVEEGRMAAVMGLASADVLLTVLVLALLLVLPNAVDDGTVRWYRIPLQGLNLVRLQGSSLLHFGQLGLLFIWFSVALEHIIPRIGSLIAFFVLLCGMFWLMRNKDVTLPPVKPKASVTTWVIGVPMAVIAVMYSCFFYYSVAATQIVLGLATGLAGLLIGYILIKLHLFPIIKWLLFAAGLFLFAGLLGMMWFLTV
jgi:hypothetical protein